MTIEGDKWGDVAGIDPDDYDGPFPSQVMTDGDRDTSVLGAGVMDSISHSIFDGRALFLIAFYIWRKKTTRAVKNDPKGSLIDPQLRSELKSRISGFNDGLKPKDLAKVEKLITQNIADEDFSEFLEYLEREFNFVLPQEK
jgi:hypothetical protein